MDAISEWPVVGIVERDGNTSHPNAALALLPNQGNMQEPAPEDDIKPTVLPRMASVAHDVTFSCHLRDAMAMGRDVPGLNRATSRAELDVTEVTSLRARTQSPTDEELKLGAKGGAMYVLGTTLASNGS